MSLCEFVHGSRTLFVVAGSGPEARALLVKACEVMGFPTEGWILKTRHNAIITGVYE